VLWKTWLSCQYPAYGFERHDGHVSPAHLVALARHDPSPIHHRHNALAPALSTTLSDASDSR